MPDIITSIKSDFAHAVVKRCEDKGCILKLDKLENYVVLKGELIRQQKDEKMCDNIIFKLNKQIIVSVVELKGKGPSLSKIKKQLEEGRNTALDILRKYNVNVAASRFYFIALATSWAATQLKKGHQKEKKEPYVEVAGKRYNIIRKKCGISSLYDIIKN